MNGNEKTPQPLGSSFPSANWQASSGIWGNSTIGAFGKRETAKGWSRQRGGRGDRSGGEARETIRLTRDPAPEEAFANGPSGSGALAATSEADGPWVNRSTAWGATDSAQTRSTSGSTSPNRTRQDPSVHESPYYPQLPMQPAIGQRGGNLSGRAQSSTLDPQSGPFKYPKYTDFVDEKENAGPFGMPKTETDPRLSGYNNRLDRRSSQDRSYLNVVGGASRDSSLPPSNHSEADVHQQANGFNDYAYASASAGSLHAQRPSLPKHSLSMSAQQANKLAYNHNVANPMDEDELSSELDRTLSFAQGPNGAVVALSQLPQYQQPMVQPFQFNPVSQSWENGYDVAAAAAAAAYGKRPSVQGRSSPSGSAYRAAVGSPKTFAGTPQPMADPWPRPSSRDPRLAPELDRRLLGQHFIQPPPSYYPHFYGPNYQQFPPQVYDPYAAGFRPPVAHIPGYGLPINPYLAGTAGVPIRPTKDQDPGKGVRSMLLEEFRSSSKSNKRFELKVRSFLTDKKKRVARLCTTADS